MMYLPALGIFWSRIETIAVHVKPMMADAMICTGVVQMPRQPSRPRPRWLRNQPHTGTRISRCDR